MSRYRITDRFNHIFEEVQFAVFCNESVEELIRLRKNDKLPSAIQYKMYYDQYLYSVSKTTYSMILGLKAMRVNKIFKLLCDAQDNNFMVQLQLNYRTLDLSNYK